MNIIWIVLAAYFVLGLLAIFLLDLFTGRVRRNFSTSQEEARQKLLTTGNYMGRTTSAVVLIGAMWLFWPAAIYGALSSGGDNGQEKRETPSESADEERTAQ